MLVALRIGVRPSMSASPSGSPCTASTLQPSCTAVAGSSTHRAASRSARVRASSSAACEYSGCLTSPRRSCPPSARAPQYSFCRRSLLRCLRSLARPHRRVQATALTVVQLAPTARQFISVSYRLAHGRWSPVSFALGASGMRRRVMRERLLPFCNAAPVRAPWCCAAPPQRPQSRKAARSAPPVSASVPVGIGQRSAARRQSPRATRTPCASRGIGQRTSPQHLWHAAACLSGANLSALVLQHASHLRQPGHMNSGVVSVGPSSHKGQRAEASFALPSAVGMYHRSSQWCPGAPVASCTTSAAGAGSDARPQGRRQWRRSWDPDGHVQFSGPWSGSVGYAGAAAANTQSVPAERLLYRQCTRSGASGLIRRSRVLLAIAVIRSSERWNSTERHPAPLFQRSFANSTAGRRSGRRSLTWSVN